MTYGRYGGLQTMESARLSFIVTGNQKRFNLGSLKSAHPIPHSVDDARSDR
jgi:type II secretory pathway component PulK